MCVQTFIYLFSCSCCGCYQTISRKSTKSCQTRLLVSTESVSVAPFSPLAAPFATSGTRKVKVLNSDF